MLILTRNGDQSIIIGDNIKIKILGTQGNKVKIGIDAPDDVIIQREEIYKPIYDESDDIEIQTAS